MPLLFTGLLVFVGAAILAFFIPRRFKMDIEALRSGVIVAQTHHTPDQKAIPQIVRDFALRNGATVGGPAIVFTHQLDQMTTGPGKPFFSLSATQLSGTRNGGFVWEATATIAAVFPIRVVDAYVAGAGRLEVRIAGSIPIAYAAGPESDKGEMMRFLAELAWNPDAIINAGGLSWRQIDWRTVEVSIETAGGTATVRHLFDASGDIIAIEADDRPYLVNGKSVPMRWIGRFRDYTQFGSHRLPRHGDVAWDLPEGEFIYFRGTIVSFELSP
jgi:hypothetical protein